MTGTLTLIGDSILDNEPYTQPDPSTTAHLQRLLPHWTVVLLARDGATMRDVGPQLRDSRETLGVVVLSVGGNDVTQHIGLLDRRMSRASELIGELLAIADDFEGRYETAARLVAERAERVVLCTIYEVPLEPSAYAALARVPLAVLNDRIVRVGGRLGAEVLELRSVCTDPQDFVLQIEPSARGAAKIAEAIAAVAVGGDGISSARLYAARARSGERFPV